jgi:hypothetical protein
MPRKGVPPEVVTVGVTVIVDVPCGVPITCGVGTTCGLTPPPPPPPHPATWNTLKTTRTPSAATRSKPHRVLPWRKFRSSKKAQQHASRETTRNQVNGGSCGAIGGSKIMELARVDTFTT